jgi:hypothetical protein
MELTDEGWNHVIREVNDIFPLVIMSFALVLQENAEPGSLALIFFLFYPSELSPEG